MSGMLPTLASMAAENSRLVFRTHYEKFLDMSTYDTKEIISWYEEMIEAWSFNGSQDLEIAILMAEEVKRKYGEDFTLRPIPSFMIEFTPILKSFTQSTSKVKPEIADAQAVECVNKHQDLFENGKNATLLLSLLVTLNSDNRASYLQHFIACLYKYCFKNDKMFYTETFLSFELTDREIHDLITIFTDYTLHSQANGNVANLKSIKEQIQNNTNLAYQNAHKKLRDYIKYDIAGYSVGFWSEATCKNGLFLLFQFFFELSPQKLDFQACLLSNSVRLLQQITLSGHLNMIKYLLEKSKIKDVFQSKIAYKYKSILEDAAAQGHVELVKYLLEEAPNKDLIKENIAVNENEELNGVLLCATHTDDLVIAKYLLEDSPIRKVMQANISIDDNDILKEADRRCHRNMVNYLLNYPSVFAYAEMHPYEYGQYIVPKIDELILKLQESIAHFQTAQPNGVFDIDSADQASLYFYVIRHLIRTQPEDMLEKMNALLVLPSVVGMLHQEVGSNGQENELLRLACSTNNELAASRLLLFPHVHRLAEAADFYRDEAQYLDVARLARDRESSIHGLTLEQQEQIADLKEHYERGVENINAFYQQHFLALFEALQSRYRHNPATILWNGLKHDLPLDYESFKNRKLISETGESIVLSVAEFKSIEKVALGAYYAHPDHTAFRFLSIPNEWMHEQAVYVVSMPNGKKHADYEGYKALISLFWMAATDLLYDGVLSVSTEDRTTLYIKALALVGRSHNWDKSTPVMAQRADGKWYQKKDADGALIFEEKDDGEADKPSCYSGMNSRFGQALHQHPLYIVFDNNVVRQMLVEFLVEGCHQYFSQGDYAQYAEQLIVAYEQVVKAADEASFALLKSAVSELKLSAAKEQVAQNIEAIFSQKVRSKYDYRSCLARIIKLSDQMGGHLIYFWPQLEKVIKQYGPKKQSQHHPKIASALLRDTQIELDDNTASASDKNTVIKEMNDASNQTLSTSP